MKKTILAPWDCEELIPNWHELDETKLQKLGGFTLRGAREGYGGNDYWVISVPPILITEDNFVLNGKHRAFVAAASGCNLEACVIRNEVDLRYHTPREAIKDTQVDSMVDMLDRTSTYTNVLDANGIHSIRDLVKKYEPKSSALQRHREALIWQKQEIKRRQKEEKVERLRRTEEEVYVALLVVRRTP